jgi:3-hydroxyisobutyrate dehydrogenase-like beta-hydroxyacid dehydrogenase
MRVGVLGLGAMGRRMAARLVAAGHEVTVWNRTPGVVVEGAAVAGSPRAVATGAEVVIAMVRDDAASAAVWAEALPAMAKGALAVECSTLSPAHVAGLHGQAAAVGVDFLDAPVAGSRPQAEAGALVFLAGGAAEVVARAEPALRAMGRAVHHAGGPGAGAVVKLMVNTLLAVEIATLAELMGLAARAGLDMERALAAVADTPVWSPALAAASGAMRARSFAPAFPVALVVKDLALAAATGAPLPVAHAVGDVFAQTMAAGHGGDNITAVVKLYL